MGGNECTCGCGGLCTLDAVTCAVPPRAPGERDLGPMLKGLAIGLAFVACVVMFGIGLGAQLARAAAPEDGGDISSACPFTVADMSVMLARTGGGIIGLVEIPMTTVNQLIVFAAGPGAPVSHAWAIDGCLVSPGIVTEFRPLERTLPPPPDPARVPAERPGGLGV